MGLSKLSKAAKRWLDWGWVFVWTLIIYLTIPMVRPFQKFVYREFGKAYFTYFVLAVLGVSLVGVLIWLREKHREHLSVGNYFWLLLVAAAYGFFTIRLNTSPEEAIHFLEYGFLSFLVFRALRHDVRDGSIYVSAVFICLFLGTIDEIIQWVVPKRYWDFRDVWLNFLSGGLFQLGLWKGIRPETIREKVQPKSVRVLSGVVAASVLLLGLCVSNTEDQMAAWAEVVPALSDLKNNETMMSEFGYLHEDVALGVRFRSRMTKRELREMDAERSEEYARMLNDGRNMKYGDFLRKYNPRSAPFLHEMRVHIFRRDRYFGRGQKSEIRGRRSPRLNTPEGSPVQSQYHLPELRDRRGKGVGGRPSETPSGTPSELFHGAGRAEAWTVAYKENLILERYFGETLKKSGYAWSEERRRKVAAIADRAEFYESPVSKQLFTRFTEKGVWLGIGGIAVVLILVNIYMSKRLNREGPKDAKKKFYARRVKRRA